MIVIQQYFICALVDIQQVLLRKRGCCGWARLQSTWRRSDETIEHPAHVAESSRVYSISLELIQDD